MQPVGKTIYQNNIGWVSNLIRRMSHGSIEVEDVIQDVFMTVIRKLDSFEHRSSIKTWIYRICINVVAEHRRRKRRDQIILQTLLQLGLPDHETDNPEKQAQRKAKLLQTQKALNRMSQKKAHAFILHQYQGLSSAEISERLNIPEPTVRTRLFHARLELAKKLDRNDRDRTSPTKQKPSMRT